MTDRIDAHHHVWDLDVRDQPWIVGEEMAPIRRTFTVDDYEREAHAAGITASVLVQTVADSTETADLLAIAGRSDVVLAVTGWVDLTAPDVADRLAELQSGPGGQLLQGIRHGVQDEPDPEWLARPDVRRGLAAVADAGLLYELLVHPRQLPAAIGAAARFDGHMVLDHCAKPPIASRRRQPWGVDLRRLARLGNVSCKVSGLVTEADWQRWTVDDLEPYVDLVLESFGPDRLMFGSDWPVCLLAATYSEVVAAVEELTAELSDDARTAIFGGTARRLYG